MRILYVLGFLPTYVKREIEALAAGGHSIRVLLPEERAPRRTDGHWRRITGDPAGGGVETHRVMPFRLFTAQSCRLAAPFIRGMRFPGNMLKSLQHREFRFFLAASETLRTFPKGWKPHVIHAHFAGDQAHIASILASILGAPYTVTTHATDIFVPRNRERLRRVLSGAGAVFTISEYNRAYMEENGIFSGGSVVAKLGIHLPSLPKRRPTQGPPVAVCTASGLVEKKGVDILLEAAELLREEYPSLRFTVIGSDPGGKLLAEYRERARDLPVDFPGTLPSNETMDILAGASMFVLPCIRAGNGDLDGIPVSLMEAMGIGLPSISTGVSGIPELIEHGQSGLLAEPGSGEDLALMIRRILENPGEARKMGLAGREKVQRQHSAEGASTVLLETFRRLEDQKQ